MSAIQPNLSGSPRFIANILGVYINGPITRCILCCSKNIFESSITPRVAMKSVRKDNSHRESLLQFLCNSWSLQFSNKLFLEEMDSDLVGNFLWSLSHTAHGLKQLKELYITDTDVHPSTTGCLASFGLEVLSITRTTKTDSARIPRAREMLMSLTRRGGLLSGSSFYGQLVSSLRHLDLRNMIEFDLACCEPLSRLANLTYLDISGCWKVGNNESSPQVTSCFSQLSSLKKLTTLKITDCGKMLEQIGNTLSLFENLTFLVANLSGSTFTNVAHAMHLNTVYVSPAISDTNVNLGPFVLLKNLTCLHCRNAKIKFSEIAAMTNLHKLDLTSSFIEVSANTPVNTLSLLSLCNAANLPEFNCPNLRSLLLSRTKNLDSSTLQKMIKSSPKLKVLNLDGVTQPLTNDSLQLICQTCLELEELNICQHVDIDNSSFVLLGNLKKLRCLWAKNLKKLTDTSLDAIAKLPLEILDLGGILGFTLWGLSKFLSVPKITCCLNQKM
jgi:hypothetical protein